LNVRRRIHRFALAEWEGLLVKITTMTPDDPLTDLEERLAALQALGPMEFEPGEKVSIASALAEINDASKAGMQVCPPSTRSTGR